MLPQKLYGIIGNPLGHSLSPYLHNWAFGQLDYPGVYLPFPLPSQEKLPSFFTAVRTLPIYGCNITIPYKVAAMDFIDQLGPLAAKVNAINTLYWQGDKLCGENTDVIGFLAPLQGQHFEHALLLGAGGVARAVIVGLQELGVERITITNRSLDKAQFLAQEFGIDVEDWAQREQGDYDLVINATSLGMKGKMQDLSPCSPSFFQKGKKGLAYDIVYTPEQTVFLQQAQSAGWQIQNGVAMFVEQARAAFRLWTSQEMPQEGAYALVRDLLGKG